jgi:hypothetical protein
MHQAAGYWPTRFQNNDGGRSDATNIAGGDIRLFSVRVDEAPLRVLPRTQPPARPAGRFLALRDITDLRQEILRRPTFFEHFDGVKLDWTYLLRRDAGQVKRDRAWLDREKVRLVIDFTSGLNHFPDLTLFDLLPAPYAESVAQIDNVLDKMRLLGASNAVIATHLPPELGATPAQITASFKRGLSDLCRRAKDRGVTLHLQNRTDRWRGSPTEILRLIDDVRADNLRFALNTSRVNVSDTIARAGKRLSMVLVNAPGKTVPEAQGPVANGGVDLAALKTLHVPVVLDAEYAGPDELFRDVQAVWGDGASAKPLETF